LIKNLEEKQKIIELLTVSMCSAPMTPSKNFILSQWYKKWGDFSRGKTILRLYKGHLVKTKGQARLEGDNCVFEFPELDAILKDTVDEYVNKYVHKASNKTTFHKNIKVFARDLETYRESCVDNLNKILQESGSTYVAKNTSHYLKHYKSGHLAKGFMNLATYSLIYDEKKLYSGTYDDVLCFLGKSK
jgi:hypothetical protein